MPTLVNSNRSRSNNLLPETAKNNKNLENSIINGFVGHVVNFAMDVIDAKVHCLQLERAKQRPGANCIKHFLSVTDAPAKQASVSLDQFLWRLYICKDEST
jgi:hypothetical protein